jgi:uncharacterized protein (TIGR00251 family)
MKKEINLKTKVHPNSSREKIIELEDGYEVWLKEKAIDGKANLKLIKLFKKELGKDIRIKSGFNSRNKVITIK